MAPLAVQPMTACAAVASPEQSVTLSELEKKFFGHQFPAEMDAIRLDRLDKAIFGEVTTGSAAERFKHLQEALAVSAVNVHIKDPGFPCSVCAGATVRSSRTVVCSRRSACLSPRYCFGETVDREDLCDRTGCATFAENGAEGFW